MHKSQHFIKVERTAEYYMLEPTNVKPTCMLYVLHGYLQLPEYFIEHFRELLDLGVLIVAPSALSFSYISADSDRVGASWMTKHNRENEIEDYLNYLEKLQLKLAHDFPEISQISLLGFSQGTATASRWFNHSSAEFDKLILVAGGIASDLDMKVFSNKISNSRLFFLFGDSDPYIGQEQKLKQLGLLDEQEIEYGSIEFVGGHQIPKRELYDLFKK